MSTAKQNRERQAKARAEAAAAESADGSPADLAIEKSDEQFVDRWAQERWPRMRVKLMAAGATEEEGNAFREQWLHDESWERDEKERVLALGVGKLAEEVLAARADGLRDTETPDEEAARRAHNDADATAAALRSEAEELSAWHPVEILKWVGNDRDRAEASLAVERAHPQPRQYLIDALNGKLA